jgi:hypothetical protein
MKGHKIVEYNGNSYAVCRFIKNGKSHLFVIDEEDLDKILEIGSGWRDVGSGIGYKYTKNKKTYFHYLHNEIMNKSNEDDKHMVNHINTITYDNRKCNLRIISKKLHNEIRKKKERNDNLPEDCGITKDDIPFGIYYEDVSGRFVIRIKIEDKQIVKYCSSDNNLSMIAKLEYAKKKLMDIIENSESNLKTDKILSEYSEEAIELMNEFNEIIELSGYKCAENNLIEIPKVKKLKLNLKKLTKKEISAIHGPDRKGKRAISNLPEDCGITQLPEFCIYRPATESRGDAFTVKKHPNQKKDWSSSTSKKVSTKEKYNQAMAFIKTLETKKYMGKNKNR